MLLPELNRIALGVIFAAFSFNASVSFAVERRCPGAPDENRAVIFCDDFESSGQVGERYFEYDNNGGNFIPLAGVGLNGSSAMRARWQPGQNSAGSLKRSFGRLPRGLGYSSQSRSTETFRELYWRLYLRTESGWSGAPDKLSRALVFGSDTSWAEAALAHVWTPTNKPVLMVEPATGIDGNSRMVTTTYNDFANLRWLGGQAGTVPVFSTPNSNRWFCIEAHAKLNDPGSSNGIFELWIDGNLDAQVTGLNWVGNWQDYAFNAVFIENYWNSGAPAERIRYLDNIVISTERIGCAGGDNAAPAPTPAPPDTAPAAPRNLRIE